MSTYNLQILSPDREFYNGEVEKIVFRSSGGDMAVLSNHMPLTTVLGIGEIKIFKDKKNIEEATLIAGFAKIEPESAVILVDAAEWPGEINVERAEEAKKRAEKRLQDSNMDHARALAALKRAIARINVADK